MTDPELQELVAALRAVRTDTLHVEAKSASWQLPRRLWETLSAFSNSPGGGVIILGLDENDGFKPVGLLDAAKLQQDLASLCADMVPPVRPRIGFNNLDGQSVLVAEVPEVRLQEKPCFYSAQGPRNGAFIRVADGNRKLTDYEVQVMLASRGQPKDDAEAVPAATLDDLDPKLVESLLGRLRARPGSAFRDLSDERSLLTVRALVRDGERSVPSIAGLLALGRFPQQYFPSLSVTMLVYPTPEVGQPGAQGERFLDNRRFEGPIPLILQPLLEALQRNMKRRSVVRGIFREDSWEYPETAIREALVNALGHRDLSSMARGAPVQVHMFPDRLEIINPGGLFGPVTVDRLGEIGVSSSRNEILMKLLEDVAIPGSDRVVCENRGSGIGAMLHALRQAGMSPPTFADEISTFSVTFPNHSLLDGATLQWLESIGGGQLSDSQAIGLALMRSGQALTNGTYRRAAALDSRVATRELGDLVRRGLVLQVGTRGTATYHLRAAAEERPGRRHDRRSEILAELAYRGSASRAELEVALGLDSQTVLFWLRVLKSEGRVDITQPSRSPKARWFLAGTDTDKPLTSSQTS